MAKQWCLVSQTHPLFLSKASLIASSKGIINSINKKIKTKHSHSEYNTLSGLIAVYGYLWKLMVIVRKKGKISKDVASGRWHIHFKGEERRDHRLVSI